MAKADKKKKEERARKISEDRLGKCVTVLTSADSRAAIEQAVAALEEDCKSKEIPIHHVYCTPTEPFAECLLHDLRVRQENEIIIVHDVESGLAPKQHRKALSDAAFAVQSAVPGTRVVATTLSPIVASSIGGESLIVVDAGGNEAKTTSCETYGQEPAFLLRTVYECESRPDEVTALFKRAGELIDMAAFDDAERVLDALSLIIDGDDPDIIGLRTAIALERL